MNQRLLKTQSSLSALRNSLLELRENINNTLSLMDSCELAIQPVNKVNKPTQQASHLGHKVMVLDTENGLPWVFDSIRLAADYVGRNESTVRGHLNLHSTYKVGKYLLSYPKESISKLP